MISHRNVIANTMMIAAFEESNRKLLQPAGSDARFTDVILGLLPQNHIYGLVVVCHAGPYRGDQVIVMPKFELKMYLSAIQRFRIASLIVVCGCPDCALHARRPVLFFFFFFFLANSILP